jgi:nucleotide-binding universal stress UspA family protein
VNRERVLVGVSDETGNQSTLNWVVQRAALTTIQVVVVSAFHSSGSERAEEEDPLARVRARITSGIPEVAVEFVPTTQSLLESLIERSASVDLLVVGASPRHRLLSTLGRSLPLRVAARAQCATVVVPVAWHPSDGPIIVGVGDDQSADRATLFAAREAIYSGCELIVVHCWSMPSTGDAMAISPLNPEEWRDSHLEILHEAVDRIRAAFPRVRIRAMLEHGRPGPQFAALADGSRLIVLGTHHRGPLTELLLGSTARDVLHAAAAPLAVVPLKRWSSAAQNN